MRHGQATRIWVTLQPAADRSVLFAISDDGCGFQPGSGHHDGGRGLDNLAQRARELGAVFTTESEPSHGTRLQFTFTPP
jgi:signal transduction histidine kinase